MGLLELGRLPIGRRLATQCHLVLVVRCFVCARPVAMLVESLLNIEKPGEAPGAGQGPAPPKNGPNLGKVSDIGLSTNPTKC